MRQILTTSRRSAFRLCARLHHVQYVRGYRPAVPSPALVLGSAVHAALEAYWRRRPLPRHPDPFIDARVRVMLEGYGRQWAGDAARYEVLDVEARFAHPLVDHVLFSTSRDWECGGVIDVIVRERASGAKFVIEHKTTTFDISPASPYWERLTMDDQCSSYVVGAESLGYDISRVLYDVLRKPPEPLRATPVEKRRYRKPKKHETEWAPDDIRLLYANQSAEDETPDQYERRLRETMNSGEHIWYARRDIPRSVEQVQAHLEDAWADALRMKHAADNSLAPRNPDACHRYGRCWLWDHCAQGERVEEHPDRYVKVDILHPELEKRHVASE